MMEGGWGWSWRAAGGTDGCGLVSGRWGQGLGWAVRYHFCPRGVHPCLYGPEELVGGVGGHGLVSGRWGQGLGWAVRYHFCPRKVHPCLYEPAEQRKGLSEEHIH